MAQAGWTLDTTGRFTKHNNCGQSVENKPQFIEAHIGVCNSDNGKSKAIVVGAIGAAQAFMEKYPSGKAAPKVARRENMETENVIDRPGIRETLTPPKTNKPEKAQSQLGEAIQQFIRKNRKGNYKGVHVVYSGLNASLKASGFEPRDTLAKLNGFVEVIPCRGGAMAYIKGEAPERTQAKALFKGLKV